MLIHLSSRECPLELRGIYNWLSLSCLDLPLSGPYTTVVDDIYGNLYAGKDEAQRHHDDHGT